MARDKEDFDYRVSEDVQNRIKEAVAQVHGKYEFVFASKLSNLDADGYLYLVVAKGGYLGMYTLWLYNDDFKSLFEGHYDMTFKGVMNLLSEKVTFLK